MRAMLLGAAAALAVAVTAVPTHAQRWSDPSCVAAANVAVHRTASDFTSRVVAGEHRGRHGDWRRGDRDGEWKRRHRRNRDRDGRDIFISDWGYYEDNAAWQADGYNDWWHDRPWRSTPRWVQGNDACERMYWSGGGWRC